MNLNELEPILRQRLASFQPDVLLIEDNSAEHAHHRSKPAQSVHLTLVIVSEAFDHLTKVARHRAIYTALAGLIPDPIHALIIQAYSPAEYATHRIVS